MKKLYAQNLGMIITEQCNLNCNHCMRGKCSNKTMSDEVIEATLSQFVAIGNLAICGGEPLLALDRLEKIFSYIIENKILVDQVTLVINGTIYKEEFLRLLNYIEEYLQTTSRKNEILINQPLSAFTISWDKYHHSEIERLNMKKQYLENITKYQESKYFYGLQRLNGKIFNEGNAMNLDKSLTVPLRPITPIMTYAGKFKKLDIENGICNIGPIIAVNTNGTITECDASIESQESLYNYGNVLIDSIEEVFIKRNSKILKPKQWYKKTGKLMKEYATYQK